MCILVKIWFHGIIFFALGKMIWNLWRKKKTNYHTQQKRTYLVISFKRINLPYICCNALIAFWYLASNTQPILSTLKSPKKKLMMKPPAQLILCLVLSQPLALVKANWQEWWTYDGISGTSWLTNFQFSELYTFSFFPSGPGYWGVINPAWNLCSRGRHQSPINLDPSQLVRDMSLDEAPKFTVDKRPISGSLHNTGQALVFRVDSERSTQMPVNITGGPLSYR